MQNSRVVPRRSFLRLASSGFLGVGLNRLLQAQAAAGEAGQPATIQPIRSCVFIFYYGGPSHLDTYDLKPHAPAEVRGEFQPIATTVPGLQICEHLPRMSRVMHKVALVRSMHHAARLHDSASIWALTGRQLDGPDRELFAPQPQLYPSFGSTVSFLGSHLRDPTAQSVSSAALPFVFHNVHDVPCQGAGFLGLQHDPLLITSDPIARSYQIAALQRADDVSAARIAERRKLLDAINQSEDSTGRLSSTFATMRRKAFELLDSSSVREALDLSREPDRVRERYGYGPPPVARGEGGGGGNGAEMGVGRQMRGQNLLVARRLVEAGVPFVNVYDFKQQGQNWDAHFKCFNQHKTHLLPLADQSLAAFIEDLDERGLLDSTLVVAVGEFGRTPKINGEGGRDHWPDCYTALLAGGGITGGAVLGASDRLGAYPAIDPVTPGDLAATILWRFGLDPHTQFHDPSAARIRQPLARRWLGCLRERW